MDQLNFIFRIYSYYLLHWLKYIPRENFLFLDGEAILKEPYKCMEDAQDFLNIDQVLDKDHFYINEEVRITKIRRPLVSHFIILDRFLLCICSWYS